MRGAMDRYEMNEYKLIDNVFDSFDVKLVSWNQFPKEYQHSAKNCELYGAISFDNRRIYINRNMDDYVGTLLHEVLHEVYPEYSERQIDMRVDDLRHSQAFDLCREYILDIMK